jgi:hypothetical protein
MAARVDISTLIAEVKEIHDQFPQWTADNAFVHWFLQAFLLADTELASKAVTGVSHDKGIDAIYLDESLRRVFLIQGKFHKASSHQENHAAAFWRSPVWPGYSSPQMLNSILSRRISIRS